MEDAHFFPLEPWNLPASHQGKILKKHGQWEAGLQELINTYFNFIYNYLVNNIIIRN